MVISEEQLEEEEIDHTLVWWLSFATDVIRGTAGNFVLKQRTIIDAYISNIIRFKSTKMIKVHFNGF